MRYLSSQDFVARPGFFWDGEIQRHLDEGVEDTKDDYTMKANAERQRPLNTECVMAAICELIPLLCYIS